MISGELRLSGIHTVTEYEMSGEPYCQKSGWKNHSNERIFQVMTFNKRIHSFVLPVMANIAQPLIGNWKRIVVADLEGILPPPLPPR